MINIYVDSDHRGMYTKRIQCEPGTNLYQVLQQHQITLPGAVCRGAGVCGGCQVYIAEEGMECRACRYMVQQDIHVRLRQAPGQQTILLCGATTNEPTTNERVGQPTFDLLKPGIESHTKLGMAVDIGTTTIASVLMNLETGQIYAQAGCMNQQAVYGADVISRIQYAGEPAKRDINGTETGLDVMHRILMRDIQSLIRYYDQIGYPESQIQRICYSGNTTMLHFLRKQSVAGMMGYPFTPEFLDGIREEQDGREILILPGKSAFVGADIVSGVRHLHMGERAEYELLIDLGTNGELWLINRERGVCTSTSCGPAFANSVQKGSVYGSSLLDQLAQAYQNKTVDQNGLLQKDYFETGLPCGEYVITQECIRDIQLAKAAIRTGIELAAYELRLPLSNIERVWLAGGFGFYLNLESAYTLGLLPEEFRGKIQIAGNTSLEGACDALLHPEERMELPETLKHSTVLDLSMSKNFQEFFLHRIPFPERTDG